MSLSKIKSKLIFLKQFIISIRHHLLECFRKIFTNLNVSCFTCNACDDVQSIIEHWSFFITRCYKNRYQNNLNNFQAMEKKSASNVAENNPVASFSIEFAVNCRNFCCVIHPHKISAFCHNFLCNTLFLIQPSVQSYQITKSFLSSTTAEAYCNHILYKICQLYLLKIGISENSWSIAKLFASYNCVLLILIYYILICFKHISHKQFRIFIYEIYCSHCIID